MPEHVKPEVMPDMPNMATFFGSSLDDQGMMIVTMIETMLPHFSDEMLSRIESAVDREHINRVT